MASNRKKVMLPHTMGKEGIDKVRARDDIEVAIYPATIGQDDLLPMLSDVAGIALSGTPYRKTEMDASPERWRRIVSSEIVRGEEIVVLRPVFPSLPPTASHPEKTHSHGSQPYRHLVHRR